MRNIFFFSIFFLLLISCDKSPETNSDIQERIVNESMKARESIIAINKQAEIWYKSKQIDSLTNYMADDIIQFPPNNKPLTGKASIKDYWKQLFQFGDIVFSLQTQEVKANGPLAIELGKYNLKFSPSANSPVPAFVDSGNYLAHWHKINDNWKVVWDAPVSSVPLPSK
ncbi:MAG: DUF4440 domain-containing protein [Bacteroidetes bacterium]|nr:DUF4440 domain-containing protein [Bacteroidota bacterium]